MNSVDYTIYSARLAAYIRRRAAYFSPQISLLGYRCTFFVSFVEAIIITSVAIDEVFSTVVPVGGLIVGPILLSGTKLHITEHRPVLFCGEKCESD